MKHNNPLSFDCNDVVLDTPKLVFDGFFKVREYTFKHRLFAGGWSGPIVRELFERGDAVVVLPYDAVTDEVVLVEQFRIGALAATLRNQDNRSPWLVECIAGMIDKDESPAEVASREAEEEAGITLSDVQPIIDFLSTPGGMSERIHLFSATVDSTTAAGIHGLDHEGEDIRVCVVKREQAIQWLYEGKIDNAPTVIALQWLQLNYQKFAK